MDAAGSVRLFLSEIISPDQVAFEFAGAHGLGLEQQLINFRKALQVAMASEIPPAVPTGLGAAFDFLTSFLKGQPARQHLVVSG